MIRLAWRSKITGETGHGEWRDESYRGMLEDWCKFEDREFPELTHFVESEK